MAESKIPDSVRKAAWDFRETMIPKADAFHGSAPLWYGWAIFDAYVAGILAERERCAQLVERLNAVINIGRGGEVRYITMAEVAAAIRQDNPNET